jgi:hypothetical protein
MQTADEEGSAFAVRLGEQGGATQPRLVVVGNSATVMREELCGGLAPADDEAAWEFKRAYDVLEQDARDGRLPFRVLQRDGHVGQGF